MISIGEITATLALRDELSSQLKVAAMNLGQFRTNLSQVGQGLQAAGRGFTLAFTAPVVAGLGLAAKAAIDFDSAFKNVEKTMADDTDFVKLNADIREMAKRLPVAADELANIASIGGQFGVSKGGIIAFTETVANLSVAIDGISADAAAAALAQIANATKTPEAEFRKLGDVLVDLGNKGASTEAVILEFATRLAGTGSDIGLTQAEIFGVGAAMANLGINAEAGGTAMSKLFREMDRAVAQGGAALDEFAKVSKMSADEFAKAFSADPMKAIDAFFKGLSAVKTEGGNLTLTLDALGITEARMVNALSLLAGSTQGIAKSVRDANLAWTEGGALATEAEKKYQSFANQMKLFRNQITDVQITIGNALVPVLISMMRAAEPLVALFDRFAKEFAKLPVPVQATAFAMLGFVAAIGPALYLIGGIAQGLGALGGLFAALTTATAASATATAAQAVATGTATAAGMRYGSVIVPIVISTYEAARASAAHAVALNAQALSAGRATLALQSTALVTAETALAMRAASVAGASTAIAVNATAVSAGGAAASTGLLARAFGLLLGPIGLVVTAIGSVAAAWASYKNDWTRAFDVLIPPLGILRAGIDALGQSNGPEKLGQQLDEAAQKAKALRDSLTSLTTASQAKDLAEMEKVVMDLARAGELNSNIMRRVARDIEAMEFTGKLPEALQNIVDAYGRAATAARQAGTSHTTMAQQLAAAKEAMAAFNAEQRNEIMAGDALGKNAEEIAAKLKGLWPQLQISTEAVELFLDSMRKGKGDTDTFAKEMDQARRAMVPLTQNQKLAARAWLDMGISVEAIAKKLGVAEGAVKKFDDAEKRLIETQKAFAETVKTFPWSQLVAPIESAFSGSSLQGYVDKLGRSMGQINTLWVELKAPVMEVRTQTEKVNKATNDWLSTLSRALSELSQIAGESKFGGITRAIGQMVGVMNVAHTAGSNIKKGLEELGNTSGNTAAKISLFVGNLASYVAAMAQAANTTNVLQAAIGGFSATAGLASGLGLSGFASAALGVAGAFVSIAFALNKARAEKRAYRDALNQLHNEFTRLIVDMQRLEHVFPDLFEEWRRILHTPGSNYNEQALKRMGEIVAELKKRVSEANEAFAPLLQRATELGVRLPRSILDSLEALRNMGVLLGDNADLVTKLMKAPTADWERMQSLAEKFGIDIDSLGAQFQQLKSNASFEEILNAFDTLKRGGADVGGVLHGMRDEISRAVNEAMRLGTTVPENMRPLINELMRTGQLYTENRLRANEWAAAALKSADELPEGLRHQIREFENLGRLTMTAEEIWEAYGRNAPESVKKVIEELIRQSELVGADGGVIDSIEELERLKFGEAIKTEFEIVTEELRNLIDALNEMASAIRGMPVLPPGVFPDAPNQTRPGSPGPSPSPADEGYAAGTISRGGWYGRFDPWGEWVKLHGTEAVIRRDQEVRFAQDVFTRNPDMFRMPEEENRVRMPEEKRGADHPPDVIQTFVPIAVLMQPKDDVEAVVEQVERQLATDIALDRSGLRVAFQNLFSELKG